jgi:C4-dicarboxylate transporter
VIPMQETGPITKLPLVPIVLVAVTIAGAGVALAAGRPVWAAALGAGLVIVYWVLDMLALRRANEGTFAQAMAVAFGGMALRLAVVLGALIAVGVFARPAFVTAAVAFLVTFTVYMFLRLSAFAAVTAK